MPTDLNVRFNKDKAFLIEQTKEFLKDKNRFSEPLTATREDVAKAVGEGNFTEALQNLEILREKQAGIKLIKIEGKDGNSPIIIRDGCENPNDSRILGTEGFEMQYLNAIRASIDLAKIEGKLGLEENLKKQAVDFINNFHDKNIGNPLQDVSSKKAQTNISANMKTEIDNLAELLGKNGIKDAYKKSNVAKDFQNFNDEHCNIVTLSKITNEQGKSYTAIEAEVALKGLTETQKQEYQNRADKKWFKKIPPWERALVNKYAEKIKEGNHVIPTQLRQIVGVKNAFEKVGAIAEMDGTDFNIFQSEKHAGTIASLSKDKESRQEITNLNAGQLQEWIGKDKILHTNTLNSVPIGAGNDPEIVSSTIKSMESVGGQNTNTAFNLARLFGGANNFSGVKNTLEQTIVNLKLLEEDSEKLKTHIKPRGRISRLFGINKPKGDAEEIIANLRLSKKIDDKTVKILRDAVKLRKDVEKADVPFRGFLDKENINLKISTSLNILTQQIALKVKKGVDEIIVMCASGKDRTGLLLHNLFAQALSSVTDVLIKDLDKQILKNGHTAEQVGSIFAGGGTIGCYGTKTENKQGIPESRKDSLSSIMEVTAKTNKIEGDSKKTDKEYAKNHPKESVKAPVVKPKSKGTNKPTPQLKPSITPAATLGVKNERER